jgi:PAS domain S-box-containing protein
MVFENKANLLARVQRDLASSEIKYRRLFEAAKDGILILNLGTGRIDDVNPFLCQLLGFSAAEMIGKTVGEVSPFRDTIVNDAMLRLLQKTGYVRYENLPLQAKDGRKIAVEFVCNVYEADGIDVIQCNIRDITERQKTEQQLALMAKCVDELNDIVLITEAEPLSEPGPRIVMVNKAFERISGYTKAEAIGRSPRFLQGPKTQGKALEEIGRAMAEKVHIRRRVTNYRKDGSEYCMEVDIAPIFDRAGTCTHFAATERDLTETVKAEEQIVEQAELLDKARDAIFVRDLKGKIAYWNQGAERIYGWKREEAVGRFSFELLSIDKRVFREMNEATIATGEWIGQVEQCSKDRGALSLEGRCTLIRNTDGSPKSVLVISTDITERKKLESQLLRAQRMESIGTLAGGIAHDLNNILFPIMLCIGMLRKGSSDPETLEILATVETSAKRGADIVRQVLTFARGIEGERVEIQPSHLLRELECIIKDTFPKDIRLRISAAAAIWTILADPTQMHQVLLNLCLNARDAMPNGGVLSVSIENRMIDEHYGVTNIEAKPGRYVNLRVTDTGTGIAPKILERIFEPFFTTKDPNKGTGLGLSTVMGIAKSHGGFVNVYSELGHGTTFNVYFPASTSGTGVLEEVAAEEPLPRGNGELVLVVDDEPSILAITVRTLQRFGYKTVTATDGADAIAIYALRKGEIAVVIADMIMPVMDGAAMIKALTYINPSIKILKVSGLATGVGKEEIARGREGHYLAKPFTAETLLRTLRDILGENVLPGATRAQ